MPRQPPPLISGGRRERQAPLLRLAVARRADWGYGLPGGGLAPIVAHGRAGGVALARLGRRAPRRELREAASSSPPQAPQRGVEHLLPLKSDRMRHDARGENSRDPTCRQIASSSCGCPPRRSAAFLAASDISPPRRCWRRLWLH